MSDPSPLEQPPPGPPLRAQRRLPKLCSADGIELLRTSLFAFCAGCDDLLALTPEQHEHEFRWCDRVITVPGMYSDLGTAAGMRRASEPRWEIGCENWTNSDWYLNFIYESRSALEWSFEQVCDLIDNGIDLYLRVPLGTSPGEFTTKLRFEMRVARRLAAAAFGTRTRPVAYGSFGCFESGEEKRFRAAVAKLWEMEDRLEAADIWLDGQPGQADNEASNGSPAHAGTPLTVDLVPPAVTEPTAPANQETMEAARRPAIAAATPDESVRAGRFASDQTGVGTATTRGVGPRRILFRRWYDDREAETFHSHAAIRDKWNELPSEERRAICPDAPNKVTRDTVKKDLRRL